MGYERKDRYYGRDQDYGYRPRAGGPDYERGRYGRDREAGEGRADYSRRPPDYDYDERGFFERAGDEVRSWFGDEEAERRRRWDERNARREYERQYGRGFSGDYPGGYTGSPGGVSGYGGFGSNGPGVAGDWGMGFGMDRSVWGFDPHYSAWRTRELSAYDRDYEEYRRENQSRFDQEFGAWRRNRQAQRESLRGVKEHQEVVGSDGAHVGTVDRVEGDRILLTKSDPDAGGHHHSIPCGWIARVGDKVEISRTAEQAQAHWRDEERGGAGQSGPHILNRSFSGTY